jgi:hypothetical protein
MLDCPKTCIPISYPPRAMGQDQSYILCENMRIEERWEKMCCHPLQDLLKVLQDIYSCSQQSCPWSSSPVWTYIWGYLQSEPNWGPKHKPKHPPFLCAVVKTSVGRFSNRHLVFDPVLSPVLTMRISWHSYMWEPDWEPIFSSHMNKNQLWERVRGFFFFSFFLKNQTGSLK